MGDMRFVVLKARPEGAVEAGHFGIASGPVPVPGDGQLLLRNIYLSVDPGVRNLLGAEEGYLPPIPIGAGMVGNVMGEVLVSHNPGFAVGDLVVGRGLLGSHSLITPDALCWRVDQTQCPTLSNALSLYGVTGLSAYFGLLHVGRPQAGETVLVSSAAGAVGSIAGQIARIKGCRAVGIAGGPEKCRRLVEEFGFDAAVDYRDRDTPALSAAIAQTCPAGVDVFFDNVGGGVLDAALRRMNRFGRLALCGQISQYDGGPPPRMSNLFYIIARSLRVEGFLLTQYVEHFGQARAELRQWNDEGRIHFREEISQGLETVIPTFLRLFRGENQGKTLVRL